MFTRILLNYDSVKLLLYKHLRKSSAYIFISSWIFISYNTENICQSFGSWYYADSLNSRRLYHHSLLLTNGNILVTGGISDSGETASCELYDISTATWRYTNPMLFPRRYHKSILLNNGKILVRGGYYLTQCEIFDPQTEMWIPTGQAKQARFWGFTMNLLNTGEVLVAGGWHSNSIFSSCELYNLDSGYWKFTGSLNAERYGHTATLMNDGRVLVVGGYGSGRYLKSVEIYDPISRSWVFTDSLNEERATHTANSLPSGKILIAGGQNFINNSVNFLNTCELFDPITQTWETVGSMVISRSQHNALQVSDSLILFTGGDFGPQYWELYNFREFMVVFTSTLNEQIYLPSSILLQSGKVINIGGAFFDMGLGPLPVCLIYDRAIVPIELTSFKLKTIDNCTSLFWETATELNNKGFEVQRKFESNDWEFLAFIPGNINSTQTCKYDYQDNVVTSGKYTYRLKQIDLDGSFSFSKELEMIVNHPRELILHQNYPNPFNPTTFIDFQIPKPNHVKVELFDVLGNKVGVLLDDFKEAGFYKIKFDGSDLSSGMYLYKIEVGDYKATKKLILVK